MLASSSTTILKMDILERWAELEELLRGCSAIPPLNSGVECCREIEFLVKELRLPNSESKTRLNRLFELSPDCIGRNVRTMKIWLGEIKSQYTECLIESELSRFFENWGYFHHEITNVLYPNLNASVEVTSNTKKILLSRHIGSGDSLTNLQNGNQIRNFEIIGTMTANGFLPPEIVVESLTCYAQEFSNFMKRNINLGDWKQVIALLNSNEERKSQTLGNQQKSLENNIKVKGVMVLERFRFKETLLGMGNIDIFLFLIENVAFSNEFNDSIYWYLIII